MKIAIVGGGAAGFFAAINMKEMQPGLQVSILGSRYSAILLNDVSANFVSASGNPGVAGFRASNLSESC